MKIELDGRDATVHKALVDLRDRFKIDVDGGPDLEAHGNLVDHEYEIEQDGDTRSRSRSGQPSRRRTAVAAGIIRRGTRVVVTQNA